jgi:hypothetical protein
MSTIDDYLEFLCADLQEYQIALGEVKKWQSCFEKWLDRWDPIMMLLVNHRNSLIQTIHELQEIIIMLVGHVPQDWVLQALISQH